MSLSLDDVRRVARLAYLELPRVQDKSGAWIEPDEHLISDERLAKLAHDLSRVLDYVAELSELDLAGVEPTRHGVKLPVKYRADEVKDVLTTDEPLEFRVPKVI